MAKRLKHDWNSWGNYLTVHEKTLKKYINRYYVSGPTQYTVTKLTDQAIDLKIRGLVLRTNNGTNVEIKIEKTAELDDYARPRARTFSYSYHALIPQPNARNLIRYCSPHEHRKYHHKHVYPLTGEPAVIEIPDDCWPHVSDFLDEIVENY